MYHLNLGKWNWYWRRKIKSVLKRWWRRWRVTWKLRHQQKKREEGNKIKLAFGQKERRVRKEHQSTTTLQLLSFFLIFLLSSPVDEQSKWWSISWCKRVHQAFSSSSSPLYPHPYFRLNHKMRRGRVRRKEIERVRERRKENWESEREGKFCVPPKKIAVLFPSYSFPSSHFHSFSLTVFFPSSTSCLIPFSLLFSRLFLSSGIRQVNH